MDFDFQQAQAMFAGAQGAVAVNVAIFAQIYTALFGPMQGAVNGIAGALSGTVAGWVTAAVVCVLMIWAASMALTFETTLFDKMLTKVLIPAAVVLFILFLEAVEQATQEIGRPLTPEQIEHLAHDLVREAKWAAAQSLSQENRRYLLDIALGAFAGVALCVALTIGAYFYGRSETQDAMAEIPPLLLNAHEAETWAKIIRNNDIQAVMNECKPQPASSGRYACWVGLWTDPPKQPQAKQ